MPDDGPLLFPPRDPERIDLAAIKTDIECVAWQIARLRRELISAAVWVALGLCVAAIAGIEMWSRYISACSSN
jgi:multisubunit Na+/H+ antiporter MnhB subunit